MSCLLVVCWIFIHISITETAPKLNQILSDQNNESKGIFDDSASSDDYLSDDAVLPPLRTNNESPEIVDENVFEGYIFDGSKCKEVNGRIQCGYDRNKGEVSESHVNLRDGCRSRGDRIECGYQDGTSTVIMNLRALNLNFEQTETSTLEMQSSSHLEQEKVVTTVNHVPTDSLEKMNTKTLPAKITLLETTNKPEKSYHTEPEETTTSFLKIQSDTPIREDIIVTMPSTNLPSTVASQPTTIAKFIKSVSFANSSSAVAYESAEIKTTTDIINKNVKKSPKDILVVSESNIVSNSTLVISTPMKDLETTMNVNNPLKQKNDKLTTADNVLDKTADIIKPTLTHSSKNVFENTGKNTTLTDSTTSITSIEYFNNTRISKELLGQNNVVSEKVSSSIATTLDSTSFEHSETTEPLKRKYGKAKIEQVCVEQKDRIVCYEIKTI